MDSDSEDDSGSSNDDMYAYLEMLFDPEPPEPARKFMDTEVRMDFADASIIHDRILMVDGKKFHVNSGLLSQFSEVFNGLFNGHFKEKHQNEIELKELVAKDFDDFLRALYPLNFAVSSDNLAALMQLSGRFMCPSVWIRCLNYLKSNQEFKNHEFKDLLEWSRGCDSDEIKPLILDHFIEKNEVFRHSSFEEIEDFLELATVYEVDNLLDVLESALIDRMPLSHFKLEELQYLADEYSLIILKSAMKDHIWSLLHAKEINDFLAEALKNIFESKMTMIKETLRRWLDQYTDVSVFFANEIDEDIKSNMEVMLADFFTKKNNKEYWIRAYAPIAKMYHLKFLQNVLIDSVSSLKRVIRGIVYKMDDVGQRALVRFMVEDDKSYGDLRIGHTHDIHHFFIPYWSIENDDKDIKLGSVVEILDYKGTSIVTCSTYFEDVYDGPTEREITDFMVIAREKKHDQLIAVTNIKEYYLEVVSCLFDSSEGYVSLSREAHRLECQKVTPHTFLYGVVISLPAGYEVVQRTEGLKIAYDSYHWYDFNYHKGEKLKPLITNVRLLTAFETEIIEQQTRNLLKINYALAVKYVLDPLILRLLLEEYVARAAQRDFTCRLYFVSDCIFVVDDNLGPPKCYINVPLTKVQHCFNKPGKERWHLRSQLLLSTESYSNESYRIPVVVENTSYDCYHEAYRIPVVVENTSYVENQTTYVRLVIADGYESVIRAIKESLDGSPLNQCFNEHYHLGPKISNLKFEYSVICEDFKKLYSDKERLTCFAALVGRTNGFPRLRAPNLEEYFNNAGKTMDVSQRNALKTALTTTGFTCITSPPGSGKTFLISKIIEAKLYNNRSARFALCTTSNSAVTNAIQMVKSNLPNVRCVRQFSQNNETDLDQEAAVLNISLRKMIRDKNMLNSLMHLPNISNAVDQWEMIQKKLQKKNLGVFEQFKLVEQCKRAEIKVGELFIRYYAPSVFCTTGSIMAQVSHREIHHLIIDEAAQVSQLDAFMLYMRLPNLTHITLIGDGRQLGPFTGLNEGTLAHQIASKSELNRVSELNSSAKAELQFIYRSHPRIMELLLKPIYGDHLQSRAETIGRNFSAEQYYNNLPLARDGSPCLFVQVNGVEKNGKNDKEIEVVCEFLKKLKGIKGEDVVILCHHKSQKDNLCAKLKGKGTVGPLKLLYDVSTVDSYQSKESKIVLLLTTKTCSTNNLEVIRRTLSFVSDPGRGTVAVSRAEHAVYLFGDWKKLSRMPFWQQFGQGIIDSGAIVNERLQPITNIWQVRRNSRF